MGSVRHQDVFNFDNHGCLCEDMMGDVDGCCNDEVAIMTIDEDQIIVGPFSSIIPKFVALFSFDQDLNIVWPKSQIAFSKYLEDPPPKSKNPRYLLNCHYIFYG